MELLLLLTAMLASLTGIGSGERGARAVQGVAVVQAASVAQAAVQPARRVLPVQAVSALRPVRTLLPLHEAQSLPAMHLPFERRLE